MASKELLLTHRFWGSSSLKKQDTEGLSPRNSSLLQPRQKHRHLSHVSAVLSPPNGAANVHLEGNGAARRNGASRAAKTKPEGWPGMTFFTSEADGDPDKPTPGMSSIGDAIAAIARGEPVVVVDDENRENEGDLILAGSLVTPESLAFMVKHTSGLICASVAPEILDKLDIPLMVEASSNEDAMRTAFTVSVDLREGTSTGISAADRARTIRALAHGGSMPSDFRRPGHVFPLRYREGGVLRRPGHTEAAVDLAVAAGLPPVGVLCEIVDWTDPKGSMARLPRLGEFAREHNLHIISIEDLIRFRRKRESIVRRTACARLPTQFGNFQIYSYTSIVDGIEHTAIVKGDIGDGVDVLTRLHSECLTGDIFASMRCDCGPQLHMCLERLEKEGRGVCVYLRGHEGRGIGLGEKLKAYNLQDEGRDTVEANLDLGLPADAREYTVGAQILQDLGVHSIRLMTNNPAKAVGIKGHGIAVTGRVPLMCPITPENKKYLEAKRSKMGHIYGSDLPGNLAGLVIKEQEEA